MKRRSTSILGVGDDDSNGVNSCRSDVGRIDFFILFLVLAITIAIMMIVVAVAVAVAVAIPPRHSPQVIQPELPAQQQLKALFFFFFFVVVVVVVVIIIIVVAFLTVTTTSRIGSGDGTSSSGRGEGGARSAAVHLVLCFFLPFGFVPDWLHFVAVRGCRT
jgi:uncharacterized membrane protein